MRGAHCSELQKLPLVESRKWLKKNVLVDKKDTMVLVTKIVVNKKLQMARYVPVGETRQVGAFY